MEVKVEAEIATKAEEEAATDKLSIRLLLNATSAISLTIFSMSVRFGTRRPTMLKMSNTRR